MVSLVKPMHPSRVMSRAMLRAVLTMATTMAASACGGGGDVAAPPPQAARLEISSIVVEDPESGDIMFSHDDHWHGFPVVAAGAARTLRVYFVKQGRAADDHDMPPRNEWFSLQEHADHSLPVVIEDPTRANWTGDRLGGQLAGRAAGASRLNFRVFRGSTTVWEAPALNLVIR